LEFEEFDAEHERPTCARIRSVWKSLLGLRSSSNARE
jgi:hypothetical protein